MAGTVKLCVPELPCVAELVGCADLVGRADLVAEAEDLARAERVAAAETAGVAEGPGPVASPDGEDDPDGADKAVAEPPEADEDAAATGFDPVPAHAVRPAPAATTAMITAGNRHILMFLPFGE